MSSIVLDRAHSQTYASSAEKTEKAAQKRRLDKTQPYQAVQSAVVVRNVNNQPCEPLILVNFPVQLDVPNAAMNEKVNELTIKDMAQLQKMVDAMANTLDASVAQTGALAVKIVAGSVDDFEVELAAIIDNLKTAQTSLKLKEIEVTKAKHKQEMNDNQHKIEESQKVTQEAKKSGLAAKIFGWISAVVSVVVGAIMVATGVGAAAGALMIAGGVMGVVSMTLQEPEVQDALKQAGIDVDALNKVVLALDIAVAVIGAVVTFGGVAAGGIAKLAAKSATKVAEKVCEMATKVATNMAKVADMGSEAASTVTKGVRYGAETVDLTVNVGKGATDSLHASHQADVANIQSELIEIRAEMTLSQAVIDKLKAEIEKIMQGFQEVMTMIMQMIESKSESMKIVLNRPATV